MNLMRTELKTVLTSVSAMAAADIPALLGELEVIRATATMRLTVPAQPAQHDALLNVETAATRLSISTDYLYRHYKQFPIARRMGRKLLFSSLGIDQYLSRTRVIK